MRIQRRGGPIYYTAVHCCAALLQHPTVFKLRLQAATAWWQEARPHLALHCPSQPCNAPPAGSTMQGSSLSPST